MLVVCIKVSTRRIIEATVEAVPQEVLKYSHFNVAFQLYIFVIEPNKTKVTIAPKSTAQV